MMATADLFIQWKGTDACFDFRCQCGYFAHVDGEFIYYLRCPRCRRVFQMPQDLAAHEVTEGFTEEQVTEAGSV